MQYIPFEEPTFTIGSVSLWNGLFSSTGVDRLYLAVNLDTGEVLDDYGVNLLRLSNEEAHPASKISPAARAKMDAAGGQPVTLAFALVPPDYSNAISSYVAAHPEGHWAGDLPETSDPVLRDKLRMGMLMAKVGALAASRQSMLANTRAAGAQLVTSPDTVPVVYLKAPPAVLDRLAQRSDVAQVLAPARYGPAMNVAKPTVYADWSTSQGYTGDQVQVGVVEYAHIDWTRPSLASIPHLSYHVSGSSCVSGQGTTVTDSNPIDHMSWVAAIIASRDTTYPESRQERR